MNNKKVLNVISLLFLSLCLSFISTQLIADDRYLEGYISSILEQQLGWQKDSYHLDVKDGVATISIHQPSKNKLADAGEALSTVPQLVDFNFVDASDKGIKPPSWVHYPRGDYFKPAIADTREPQFFISLLQNKRHNHEFLMASVGMGDTFGLYRWPAATSGDGWQLGFFAGLFSQFNMDTSSDDLLNSDYIVGFPLSYKSGDFSARFRLLHLSSHLGDELLLSGEAPERINLSIEAIDISLAYEIGNWRGIAGALRLISHDPSYLEEQIYGLGLDYRNPTPVIGNSRFIAGIFTEWLEEVDWNTGTSIKFGLEIGQTYPRRHGTRIMVEAYKGFAPFGQFFVSDIEYYGLGVYFDF